MVVLAVFWYLTSVLDVGKTTLVHSILKGQHGLKIAVIMNEFGEEQELEKEMLFQTEVVL